MNPDQILQMLSMQGMQQQAAPTPAQPGGGPQTLSSGLSPEQEDALMAINITLVQAKATCQKLAALGADEEYTKCEKIVGSLADLQLKTKQKFMEQAQERQLASLVNPNSAATQNLG